MMITKQNLKGGRKLAGYPLVEDNGMLGYKLGYCEGCNEPVLIRTLDLSDVVAFFGISQDNYKRLVKDLRPKVTLKDWLIRLLGGLPVQNL